MEKVLSRHPLTSMTRAPERIGDLVWRRRWNSFEILVDTIHQSQSSGLPERGLRTTLEQSTRRLPLPKSHCVRHRRTATDNGSPRLNVRVMVEERRLLPRHCYSQPSGAESLNGGQRTLR